MIKPYRFKREHNWTDIYKGETVREREREREKERERERDRMREREKERDRETETERERKRERERERERGRENERFAGVMIDRLTVYFWYKRVKGQPRRGREVVHVSMLHL